MTRRSGVTRYSRRPRATSDVEPTSRLPAVRVRIFELRLIALALAACWIVAAGLVLIAYRPGGPIDVAGGFAAPLPAAVAVGRLGFPPPAPCRRRVGRPALAARCPRRSRLRRDGLARGRLPARVGPVDRRRHRS